jgi:hypothetical protein
MMTSQSYYDACGLWRMVSVWDFQVWFVFQNMGNTWLTDQNLSSSIINNYRLIHIDLNQTNRS